MMNNLCRWEDLISGKPATFLEWTPGNPNGLHYQVSPTYLFVASRDKCTYSLGKPSYKKNGKKANNVRTGGGGGSTPVHSF